MHGWNGSPSDCLPAGGGTNHGPFDCAIFLQNPVESWFSGVPAVPTELKPITQSR